jgi:hypothetical protein
MVHKKPHLQSKVRIVVGLLYGAAGLAATGLAVLLAVTLIFFYFSPFFLFVAGFWLGVSRRFLIGGSPTWLGLSISLIIFLLGLGLVCVVCLDMQKGYGNVRLLLIVSSIPLSVFPYVALAACRDSSGEPD